MIEIEQLRAEAGVASKYVYLNNARVSPLPRPAMEKMKSMLEQEYLHGWSAGRLEGSFRGAQEAVADLINASSKEIAITQSASYSVNLIVNGLNWCAGDNVIISDLAYQSVAQSVLRVCEERAVQLRVVCADGLLIDPQAVLKMVDERTRLVVIPQLPVFCGVPQPIAEIGRLLADTPALFAVNATQAAGQLPIDVQAMKCDFLFGTSRKWLRGPRGLGFLYVRQSLISTLRPTNLGDPSGIWTNPDTYQVPDSIDRFHLGDYPYMLLAGFTESLRYARKVGIEAIAERNRMLGRLCRETLSSIGGVTLYDIDQGVTGTIPCNVDGVDAEDVVNDLLAKGIVTCILDKPDAVLGFEKLKTDRLIRISVHYYNTEHEIELLANALAKLRSTRASRPG